MFYKNLFMTSDSKLGAINDTPSQKIDQKMKASLILGQTAEKKALQRKPTVWDQVSKQKYLHDLEIENRTAFVRQEARNNAMREQLNQIRQNEVFTKMSQDYQQVLKDEIETDVNKFKNEQDRRKSLEKMKHLEYRNDHLTKMDYNVAIGEV